MRRRTRQVIQLPKNKIKRSQLGVCLGIDEGKKKKKKKKGALFRYRGPHIRLSIYVTCH